MYSIFAQVSATTSDSTNTAGTPTFNNKISFELLYLVRGGPTFGGRYVIEARNDNETTAGQAYGPSAGYIFENGAFIVVTYDVLAKLGRWTNGEGFQFDFGYMEHIGRQLHVGAKYSFRTMRYKTDTSDNTAVQKDLRENFPSLVLSYLF